MWTITQSSICRSRAVSVVSEGAASRRRIGHIVQNAKHPLVNWVLDNGGAVREDLDVVSSEELGLGLRATSGCSSGELLIRLPKECQLTYGSEADDPRLMKLISHVPEANWIMRLAMCVLRERSLGDASAFRTYISCLPPVFPGIPMFFSGEAIKALWYPPLISEVTGRCRAMAAFHKEHLDGLPGSEDDPFNNAAVDLNGLGWAMAAVSSRAFGTSGPSAPRSLLPLIDMCNHSFDPNCSIVKKKDGAIELSALRSVAPGEPLFLSYGKLQNQQLLLDYGFMVPGNPYDHVSAGVSYEALMLTAEIAAGVELSLKEWQLQRLATLGLSSPSAVVDCAVGRGTAREGRLPLGVDARLHAVAMIICANKARDLKDKSPTASAVRAAAVGLLTAYVQLITSRFQLDIKADQELVSSSEVAADMRLAVESRLGIAMMLQEVYADLVEELLRLAGGEQAPEAADLQATLQRVLRSVASSQAPPVSRGFGVKAVRK